MRTTLEVQRYYSSIMGRFLTPDPGDADLVHPQSFNRYTYGYGDPINSLDPTGSTAICADDFLSSGAGGGAYPCYDPFGHIQVGISLHTVAEYDDLYGDPHCGGRGYSFLPNGHPYCAPGGGGGSPAPPKWQMFVIASADCYRPFAGEPGVWERDVTYSAFQVYGDGTVTKLTGDGSTVIKETLTYISGQKPPASPSKPGQPFFDQISIGNGTNFTLTQTFSVTYQGNSYNAQIQRLTGNVSTSNSIDARRNYVDISRGHSGQPSRRQEPTHPIQL